MKIIDLPLARLQHKHDKKDQLNFLIQKIDPEIHTPLYGPWKFTCINCGNQTNLHTSGLILKNLEFFCNNCGSLWRISNPAINSKNNKSKSSEVIELANLQKSSQK
jgi:transcription elongation factor Elf1